MTVKSAVNYNYGILNRLKEPDVFTEYSPGTTSGIDTVKNMCSNNFTTNTMSSPGGFRAVCLRVEGETRGNAAGTFLGAVFGQAVPPGKTLLAVRARIPELHAMICDPFKRLTSDGTLDPKLVDQYPTFIAQTHTISAGDPPAPGDIINVDFGDRTNMTEPTYLGKLLSVAIIWSKDGNTKKNFKVNNHVGPLHKGTNTGYTDHGPNAPPHHYPYSKQHDNAPDLYPGAKFVSVGKGRVFGKIGGLHNVTIHTGGGAGSMGSIVNTFLSPYPGCHYGSGKRSQAKGGKCSGGKSIGAAHFSIDRLGRVTQMAALDDLIFHGGSPAPPNPNGWKPNHMSIGIEHAAPSRFIYDPDWWTGTEPGQGGVMMAASAKLVAWLATKFNMPVQRAQIQNYNPIGGKTGKGVMGHGDVSGRETLWPPKKKFVKKCKNKDTGVWEVCKYSPHHDPGTPPSKKGPGFPWDDYVKMLKEEMKHADANRPADTTHGPSEKQFVREGCLSKGFGSKDKYGGSATRCKKKKNRKW